MKKTLFGTLVGLGLVAIVPLFSCAGTDDATTSEDFKVVQIFPADGAANVVRSTAVRAVFSHAVKESSLGAESFYLEPETGGAWSWNAESLTATFRPGEELVANTEYRVVVTRKVLNTDGQPLKQVHSSLFTTGSTSGGNNGPGAQTSTRTWGGQTATVTISERDTDTRSYRIETTANLRDNLPESKDINITENPGQMIVRGGNDLFDALFAMSIEEVRQNSVSSISDGAFNNGGGVPCDCFETGEKWNYVWTRDTAYAVDLGLAFAAPGRSKRSLDYKLSEQKSGGNLQIVQDTGTGGSYPVSTDRVVWAIGAWEVLKFLDGTERSAFLARTYEAMVNTIEQDRAMVWDERDGLYRGEQSFLDWREQSYASWTARDTVHIGMSKSLSTNVGHFALLSTAARLAAERGEADAAQRYEGWANALNAALHRRLWLEGAGTFSAMTGTELDSAALHKYDLLGLSLAILQGLTTEENARSIVSVYPRSSVGTPVLWPQQPLIPIYHNRGIWPFVSAYALLAARQTGNGAAFDHDLNSLMRGAALNLSNMENFEFQTMGNWVDDGDYSGPVVNSRRQLWSVAAYVGAIVKGVFGLEATQDGVRFQPFITAKLRNDWFKHTDEIVLQNVPYRGKLIDVRIALPPADPAAEHEAVAFEVGAITLNGEGVGEEFLTSAQLEENNTLVITLTATTRPAQPIKVVQDDGDYRRFFAPREPNLRAVTLDDGRLHLEFDANGETDVVFSVYRNGLEVASNLSQTSWTDTDSGNFATKTYCYAVESTFSGTGNRSHHSQPLCYWGADSERVVELPIHDFWSTAGPIWTTEHGRPHYENWGGSGDRLEIAAFRPRWTGSHYLQFVYSNGAGPISTGITAAVKLVTIKRVEDGEQVASGHVFMPQFGEWERWGESSLMHVDLDANTVYSVTVSDSINMSYFAHFEPYTAGHGGGDQPYNQVNISAARFLPMEGTPRARGTLVSFDGDEDLGKLGEAQRIAPFAPYQEWDSFGMDWDDEYLYFALAAEAFADPYKPLMIYVRGTDDDDQDASPAVGLEYDNAIPELPFTPTFAIAARRLSDDGSDGPWNGIWRRAANGDWSRQQRLIENRDWWISADNHTLSLRIPRAALHAPQRIRLVAHVVNAEPGSEWKDVVPASHTPWASQAGGYFDLDLTQRLSADQWMQR